MSLGNSPLILALEEITHYAGIATTSDHVNTGYSILLGGA